MFKLKKICDSMINASGKFSGALILLFLIGVNVSFADGIDGSVSGTVIDKASNGVIENTKIALISQDNKNKFETSSDIIGKFSFQNIPEGYYNITTYRLGYEREEINEIYVSAGQTTNVNIFLESVSIEIEKINVTATKTEVTLKQTPSSINIISKDEIENKNSLTFDELLNGVQGITVFKTSGINVQGLSIRGSSDVAGGGIGNRVLLLLDGRPSLTGDSKGALWSLIPTSVIERTEVVKGAFSSLYGSSAIGGVVNVITKKPTYIPLTSLNLNFGFYENLNDSLKWNNNLNSFKTVDLLHSNTYKKFAYLFNFSYKQNDGHAEQTDYEFYSGLAKMMYDVISNRDLEVTFQFTKSNSGFPHYWRKDAGKVAEPYKVAPYYIGDRISKETHSIDAFYTAFPSPVTKYTSRFYYFRLGSTSFYNPINPVSLHFASDPSKGFETFITSHNFGNISQLDYQVSDKNYLIGGIDLQWNVVRSDPESILYGNQQVNNFGVFLQDQHKIISDENGNSVLSATAGIRYDYNHYVGFNKFDELSPKLSFLYSPATQNPFFENTSFRILIGKAFRAPSIAELYFKKELFGGFDFIFNPGLKPEEMVSAEIGFRKQFKDRFAIDVSAYFNMYDNMIQYTNIGSGIYGPFQVQNLTKAQIKGIEFLIEYSSAFKLIEKKISYGFNFNYSLIDARNLSEKRKTDFLPYKPAHLINFTTDLNYSGYNLNFNGKYTSKVDEVIFYKYEEPEGYFLANLKLSKAGIFGIENASLFFAVNNLFDVQYQDLERIQAPNRNFSSGVKVEF